MIKRELNNLEKATLDEIIEANKTDYLFLKDHIPLLAVKSREYTGVGLYVNFEYVSKYKVFNKDKNKICDCLSSNKRLVVYGLHYDLSFELNITNGEIDFLEFITNGDKHWDGSHHFFNFLQD